MSGWRAAAIFLTATWLAAPAASAADLENGRAVAVGAAQRTDGEPRPQACFSCHGVRGEGDSTGAFPRLAGQSAFYMYKQLLDYASGERPNDIMTPIAKALTEPEMEDVSAYYAAQTGVPYPPPPAVDPRKLQRGAALSAMGDAEKGVQACVNCHGPEGIGMPPSFPYLAGQGAAYTQLQLQLWQQDVRRNDPLDVMRAIAKRLDRDDVEAVAKYFEAVRPPTD